MSRLLADVADLADFGAVTGSSQPARSATSVTSLDMLMSLEIRRNICEKPRHTDEP